MKGLRLSVVLAISALLGAGAGSAEQAQTEVSDHAAAGEAHGGEHHHRNHIAVFVGSTEAEEHHGEKGDRDFTIGVDYERRLSKVVGVGGLLDWVVEGRREYLVGIPLFLHAGKHAKFQLAPCYQKVRETGSDEFVLRTGFMWDFFVGTISLSPTIFYDFTEEQDFLVFGLTVGKGF